MNLVKMSRRVVDELHLSALRIRRFGGITFDDIRWVVRIIFQGDDMKMEQYVNFELAKIKGGLEHMGGVQFDRSMATEEVLDPVRNYCFVDNEAGISDDLFTNAPTICHGTGIIDTAVQGIRQAIAVPVRWRNKPVDLKRKLCQDVRGWKTRGHGRRAGRRS